MPPTIWRMRPRRSSRRCGGEARYRYSGDVCGAAIAGVRAAGDPPVSEELWRGGLRAKEGRRRRGGRAVRPHLSRHGSDVCGGRGTLRRSWAERPVGNGDALRSVQRCLGPRYPQRGQLHVLGRFRGSGCARRDGRTATVGNRALARRQASGPGWRVDLGHDRPWNADRDKFLSGGKWQAIAELRDFRAFQRDIQLIGR